MCCAQRGSIAVSGALKRAFGRVMGELAGS